MPVALDMRVDPDCVGCPRRAHRAQLEYWLHSGRLSHNPTARAQSFKISTTCHTAYRAAPALPLTVS
jgi:hypothetical protein